MQRGRHSIFFGVSKAACNALVCTLVLSHRDYCNSLLAGAPFSILNRLQRVQNAETRLVAGRTRVRSDRFEPLQMSLHWLPIQERIDYKTSQSYERYGAWLFEGTSEALHQLGRDLRSVSKKLLHFPRIRRDRFGARSFSKAAPEFENSLPPTCGSLTPCPSSHVC